ncbi:ABC transporter ATP-binding protein [candidate division KSB1 bacterium]|nr:ABC transporter ATP-binding protein [candidate division KSB1 bacterium]MBL7093514.1 ABC transporter ATP-binding protein [candidate division KSB1 bacterium]
MIEHNKIAVRTNKLTRRFGKFTAVDQVSIEVKQGEIFGFLGANGAGKTTMIRMLCGLLKPSAGDATVSGFDVYKQSENIKKNIGYMSQKFSLYDDLTIQENIEFFGGIYGLTKEQIQSRKKTLLKEVRLTNVEESMTRDLPVGFKQRLALGCALLHDPLILFLDEPTSGVDPEARRSFWDLIYHTAEAGKTIFVTTHFMDEAEYCHRLSIMRDGKLIAVGSPGELRDLYHKSNMQDVFIEIVNGE